MKKHAFFVVIVVAVGFLTSGSFGQTEADLDSRLRTAFSAEKGHQEVAEWIEAASPQQRKAWLAAIVRVAKAAVDAPSPRNHLDNLAIDSCAYLLGRASDDKATLAAFGSNLNRIGTAHVEKTIIEYALSHCLDPKAVEVMAEYGRARIRETRQWLSMLKPSDPEDQRMAGFDRMLGAISAIEGLATSRNSSGRAVARELRDELAKVFEISPYRDSFLDLLATEVDPVLREVSKPDRPRSGGAAATPIPKGKQVQQSKAEQPATVAPSGPKPSSSSGIPLIAGAVAALALLAVLIWFLRKK